MNKKQARIIALDVAIDVLYSEWQGSSDRTLARIEEHGFTFEDQPKVQQELEVLMEQFMVKRQRQTNSEWQPTAFYD